VLALVIVLLAVVALLCIVMAGLLRSHADILRALHSLGVGVGDPAERTAEPALLQPRIGPELLGAGLPAERHSSSVHDLNGVSPQGDPVVVSMSASPLTLLAFLSSGCTTCASIWAALGDAGQLQLLPPGVRVVAVTKGPEFESPADVSARAHRGLVVVMSTQAWGDYEVPGSPFFALVDGGAGRRVGEGAANSFAQIADLVSRAHADAGTAPTSMSQQAAVGLNGAEREAANDAALLRAGVQPGDPSLYPRTLEDVFPSVQVPQWPDSQRTDS
jgi:hypothetical protein